MLLHGEDKKNCWVYEVGKGLKQRNSDEQKLYKPIGRKVTLLHEKYNGNSEIKAYIAPCPNYLLNSQLLIYNKEFGDIDISFTSYIYISKYKHEIE